jgi:hypothetical protein
MSPRKLQNEIKQDFRVDEAVWSVYRTTILDNFAEINYEDLSDHLLREYNRKIINLGLSQNLMFSPFDSGFRFLGDTIIEPAITGFAYPNETLTAPSGSSYLWTIDEENRGTNQTFIPTVYDIGKTVTCLVGGATTYSTTIWHPSDIPAVKNFWWAAQGAYNTIANGVTDENAILYITPYGGYSAVSLARNGAYNGKAYYSSMDSYCRWNNVNSRWEYYITYGDENSQSGTSLTDATYPWDATWNPFTSTFARQTTTYDVAATDGQSVTGWRDIIGGEDATAAAPNAGLYESDDLDTPSIKFDPVGNSNDFFTLTVAQRSVFNSKNYCYIFAGAQDPLATESGGSGGDLTHGVVGINRFSLGSRPKVGLVSKLDTGSNRSFGARAGLNTNTTFSANFIPTNTNYNVLATEALYGIGSLRLRVNGSEAASTAITVETPNNTTSASYIGAYNSNTSTNFNGYMTAVILAAGDSPLSATDRSRIERFIGLLDSGIDIPLV